MTMAEIIRDPRYIPGAEGYADDFRKRLEAYKNAPEDGPPSRWVPEYVGQRIIAAVKAGGRRYGPKAWGSAWPDTLVEYSDLVDPEARKNHMAVREALVRIDEEESDIDARLMAPTLVEQALRWPMLYLRDEQLLSASLIAWAMAQAGFIKLEPFLRRMKTARRSARIISAVQARVNAGLALTPRETGLLRAWKARLAELPEHQRMRRIADISRMTSGFAMPVSKTSLHRYRKRALAIVCAGLERDRVRVR